MIGTRLFWVEIEPIELGNQFVHATLNVKLEHAGALEVFEKRH